MNHARRQALKNVMGGTGPVCGSQHRFQSDCIERQASLKPFAQSMAQSRGQGLSNRSLLKVDPLEYKLSHFLQNAKPHSTKLILIAEQ